MPFQEIMSSLFTRILPKKEFLLGYIHVTVKTSMYLYDYLYAYTVVYVAAINKLIRHMMYVVISFATHYSLCLDISICK